MRPNSRVGVRKTYQGKNKLVINIPTGKGRPVCEVQSAKLSPEIGVISQQIILLPTKWKTLKDDEKLVALERLIVSAKY